MKTSFAKREDLDKRKWYVIDARNKVLGRLSTQVADILRGKRNPAFTPHVDTGDFVVVINAQKVKLTGKKLEKKTYYRQPGYIGGIKAITAEKLLLKKPEELVRHAVKGMLPKNRLGSQLLRKLKISILFAAAGALLFGIQPMRVESVAWVAERKDVLYALFYFAALLTHVKFAGGGEKRKNYYGLTLLFFVLALLSKIEAVTLPLSMLLIDYYL